jgi:hypothetical protein
MKRWLLAIALLLGPVVGMVWSDYVVIVIDLTRLEESQAKKDKNGKAGVGNPLFPGKGNLGGAAMGMPGGALGARGGFGAMGAGALGNRGGGALGGGALGGAFGARGGAGAIGGAGFQLGQMGGPGFPGQGGTTEEENDSGHLFAIAYLELKHKVFRPPVLGGKYYEIDTNLGKAYVPVDLVKAVDTTTESVAKRFKDKKRLLYKQTKTPTVENVLILAGWALEHGLLKDFTAEMDDLVKVDPTNPAAAAYLKVRKDMQKPLSQAEPAYKVARGFAEGYREEQSAHYVLWAGEKADAATVKRFLDELERTYETFFYWFALKGRALDVPTRRLVAILEDNRDNFDTKHMFFDSTPAVADGFLARRDNLAVLSAQRTDDAYVVLDKINDANVQRLKVQREELISEKIYKKREVAGQGLDLFGYQTLALMQKAMQEESIRASASHEAVRQLLAATGLIPRNVGAPEWLRFGLASFLETPQKAFYHGVGIQSWMYLRPFQDLLKEKDRPKNEVLLLRVLGDRYFHHAYQMARQVNGVKDDKEKKDELREHADKELERARCTAWALTYFLNQDKARRDQLENFFQELASLPRDQEFGETDLIRCFARSFPAFGLLDKSDPNKLNPANVQVLANRWVAEMEKLHLDVEAKYEIPKKDPTKKPRQPPTGRPGLPGGFGAPGGPGGPGASLSPNRRSPQGRLDEAIRQEWLGRGDVC